MFQQGLKLQVQEELMRINATTNTLDKLINKSIQINNKLYQLRLETKSYRKASHVLN
jgi:hypothetical protein